MRHERSFSPPTDAPDYMSPATRSGGIVARYWRAFWERRARYAMEMLLHSLDDRTLNDIGLSRSEIGSAAHGGWRRHPTYNGAWRWRGSR
jgi:uncharacterized protein YjiS (DUF1127 family)